MKDHNTDLFTVLSMIFITCFIVSNIIAGKMWALTENIAFPASVIMFPVTYVMADIFTEVYGFERTRRIIWAGFACNFIAGLGDLITVILPYPAFWLEQNAYAVVLGTTPRLLIGSLLAYLIGEFSNSILMSKLKIRTKGKYLWVRTIGSSVIGEGLDSLLFILIAFAGTVPSDRLFSMIVFQYLFKLGFEVLFTPLTYWLTGTLKKKEEIDTYDYEQKYRII